MEGVWGELCEQTELCDDEDDGGRAMLDDLDAEEVVVVLMLLTGRPDSTLAGEAFFGVDNLPILEGVEGGVRLGKLTFTVSAL